MKKKNKDSIELESYVEEYEEVSGKEQEIIDSYMDKEINNYIKEKEKKETKLRKANEKILKQELEDEDLEEYEIEDDFVEDKESKTKPNIKKIASIIIGILLALVILAGVDILCVTKLNKGPFFAIPVHTYEDGGTKEYLGLGYKVIKYNQVQGRRDLELGTWSLKYSVNPIYIDILDLAIEFNENEEASYKKYNKELLVVTGSLKSVNKEKRQIVMSFDDEDGKYTLEIVCDMESDQDNLEILEPKYEISAMGSMVKYKYKTEKTPSTIYLANCFAEQ